ncbi:MAG: SNF2-related protein [Myxococcota bacterium]
MSQTSRPNVPGQLVWSPADPSLGIGLVTDVDGSRVTVRFWRLQGERIYTTRSAEPTVVRYLIGRGEKVLDQDGGEQRVVELDGVSEEGLANYRLENGETVVESDLIPEIRDIGAKERLATLNLAHPEIVRARLQGLELAALGKRPGHAAVLGSRVEWLPHQIDVASRAVGDDPVRLLLADEVGLGKTVEAALIYAGLREEGRAERVLILTPKALTIQWLGEIYRKAHELLVLFDEQRVEDALMDHPDMNPFEAHQRMAASIDFISADEDLLELAMTAPWDLVVVDEAHHLRWRPDGMSNEAYQLVEGLAAQSRHLLLLTATPMALDPAEYHALLRLLDPARFDDPSAFDRIASRVAEIREVGRLVAEIPASGKKLAAPVKKRLSKVLEDDEEDLELLEQLSNLTGEDATPVVGDVLDALRERHGLADFVVRNRRGPVGGLPQRISELSPLEPSEKQEVLIDVAEQVMMDLARSMDDEAECHMMLGRLMRALWGTPHAIGDILGQISEELAQELQPLIDDVVDAPFDEHGLPTGDVRLRWLLEKQRGLDPDDKLLVFVESQVAVRGLKSQLEPVLGPEIATFYRALPPRDQDRQVAWFRDPEGPQIMLSTEAGGEGRNFQFCNKVILYDLPWRPATIEQRIGRIDRVGQKRDVHVLVPYFKSGYEAAILKVMQQSIGVLDQTVGGIDHQLEYVSTRLSELILSGAGVDGWKALYLDTEKLVSEARARIENEVDPILDSASFSRERADEILSTVPDDLERRIENFVERFAENTRLSLKTQGPVVSVEGAPSATRRGDPDGGAYAATFDRTYALDHEEVEFVSFGHPLVEQALEWAAESSDASAGLALLRGFDRDGAAFLWSFGIDTPEDVPEARTYLENKTTTLALDEGGNRWPDLEELVDNASRGLDRMDATPLKQSLGRWRSLVEQNFEAAERMMRATLGEDQKHASQLAEIAFMKRHRSQERAFRRAFAAAKKSERDELEEDHEFELARLDDERRRVMTAIDQAVPRLYTVIAVRLMRGRSVSG